MRIYYLQHVPFEGPGHLATWARNHGHTLQRTAVFAGDPFPTLSEFEWLVVLGGPMNVDEEDAFPWLAKEKEFIAQAVFQGKTVLGICLGAQLIAQVLGSPVFPNDHREIGWHPVTLTPQARRSCLFHALPESFVPFHWHQDTFSLPAETLHLARSEGCANQAFQYRDRVIGLQFHLELTPEDIGRLSQHAGEQIVPGPYVQSVPALTNAAERFQQSHALLHVLLDALARGGCP